MSIGGSKLQPLYSACCAPFCEHKARFRPQPRPVSTRLDSCTSLTLQAAGLRRKKQAPSLGNSCLIDADEHKARRYRRPGSSKAAIRTPCQVPGDHLLRLWQATAREASHPPGRLGRSPEGPETRRRMDGLVLQARLDKASTTLQWRQASPALRSQPPTQPDTRSSQIGSRTLRSRAMPS